MPVETASLAQPGGPAAVESQTAWVTAPRAPRPLGAATRAPAMLELGLSITGVALSLFMVSHMGLLFTILIGSSALDGVADFLETYYLLHLAGIFVITFIVAHTFLAARKAPATFTQQRALMRHMRGTRHVDTLTWAVQIVSGVALLVLAGIHLWVILTDLPISAAKSGTRVFEQYLWIYIPFLILVEAHISFGVYRVAMKWGLLSRRWAHPILWVWTAGFLALGFAILIAFYQEGA